MTVVEGAAATAHRLVAFINTLHRPDGDDALADERGLAWLADWLGYGDHDPDEHVARDALLGLRALREGLRQLAAANNGQQPDAQTLIQAATVLESVPVLMRLGDHRQAPCLVAAGTDAAGHAIAAVAQSYLTVQATEGWSRVKACAAPDCRWAYLDTSRNRSRRWCDMTNCGNRAKNRTWRTRQRVTENRN